MTRGTPLTNKDSGVRETRTGYARRKGDARVGLAKGVRGEES